MKSAMQKIHEARTIRANNNIKMMFETGDKFGMIYTEKERQTMRDLYPGIYKIFTKEAR